MVPPGTERNNHVREGRGHVPYGVRPRRLPHDEVSGSLNNQFDVYPGCERKLTEVRIKGEKVASKDCVTRTFASTIRKPSAFSQRVTPPMTCPSCGSTHFIKALAEEFSNTGYGSAEFRALTGFQPLSVYVCLCGTPMPVQGLTEECHYNNTPKGRHLRSLHKAIAHRKAHQPQVLAQGCVSLG